MKLLLLLLLTPLSAMAGETKVTVNELATIVSSSTLIMPAYTTAQAAFTNCVTGSTLTITSNGGRFLISFSGAVKGTQASFSYVTYCIDGVCSGSIVGSTTGGNGWPENMSFARLSDTLAVGQHSVCLSFAINAGTLSLMTAASDGFAPRFQIMEIR